MSDPSLALLDDRTTKYAVLGSVGAMELRLARPSDAEAIRAIYNKEVAETTVTFDIVERTIEDQRAWMQEHDGVYPVIVGTEGDTVLGFASLSPYRPRAGYSTTVENSIYVTRASRGKGVGKALLEEIVWLASVHGFHVVIARIVGDHEVSIALHRSCGFSPIGVEREVGRKFGRWLDVVVMQYVVQGQSAP
jgi:phosphinothricin acetyltransferase